MSRDELVERFTLERVGASPAVFDFEKLDWLNGVYLRALPLDEYADRLVGFLREQGYDWDEALVRQRRRSSRRRSRRSAEFPGFAGFLFERRRAGPGAARRRRREHARQRDAGRASSRSRPRRSSSAPRRSPSGSS